MKKHITQIMSWLLILTLLLGSNAMPVLSEEITCGGNEESIIGDESIANLESNESNLEETGEFVTQEVGEIFISGDDVNLFDIIVETPALTEEPVETQAEAPAEALTEEQVVESTEEPVEKLTEEQAEISAEVPAVEPTEVPTEAETEDNTEILIETPTFVFEQGYVRVSVGTIVYKAVRGEEIGCFVGDGYAYAVVQHQADELYNNWFKVTFDTNNNRENGLSFIEGYVKGECVYVLSDEEANTLNSYAAHEPGIRSYRGLNLPASQYEVYVNDEAEAMQIEYSNGNEEIVPAHEYEDEAIPSEGDSVEEQANDQIRDNTESERIEESTEIVEQSFEDETSFEITEQPKNVMANIDETVRFTVEATGDGLIYQWQNSKNQKTWKNSGLSGCETKTIKIKVTEARYPYYWRCAITDAAGNTIYTDAVQILKNEVLEEAELTEKTEEAPRFENGYVRIAAGTIVYASACKEDELGTVNTDAVVYVSEVIYDEEGNIEWMHVNFETTEEKMVDGYAVGASATIIEDESKISIVSFTFKEAESLERKSIYVPKDTTVYEQLNKDTILGAITEAGTMYVLEVVDAGTAVWLRVFFAMESGETLEGYILYTEEMAMSADGGSSVVKFEKTEEKIVDKGYARLSAGTIVYTTIALEEELGILDEEVTLYAELVKNEIVAVNTDADTENTIKAFKIFFATDDDTTYEGYINETGIEFLQNEDDLGLEVLLPVVGFTPKIQGITEGLWVYNVIDEYATVLGYLDYEVTGLSIPDQLGGYFVNAIGEKAFLKNTKLTNMYIHGNVITIADDAFANTQITLSGYNGTKVLSYAQEKGMPSENRTYIDYITLAEGVVDYSYAPVSRYNVVSESLIDMNLAEAAQLKTGSVLYVPEFISDVIYAWCVQSISIEGNIAHISIEKATAEESITSIDADNIGMYADWSKAVWADGVSIIEEKGWFDPVELGFAELTLEGKPIKISYEVPLGSNIPGRDASGRFYSNKDTLKFFIEGSISIPGKASFKAELISLSKGFQLKEAKFSVSPAASFKTGFKFGDNQDKKNTVTKYQVKNGQKVTGKKDYWLCSVPLVSAGGVVSITASLYFRIGANGEVVITTGLSGEIGTKYNGSKGVWEKINTITWKKPELDASVTIESGLKGALEVKAACLGKVVSLNFFAGLVIEAQAEIRPWSAGKYDFNTGETTASPDDFTICADIKVSVKVEASLGLELKWLKEEFGKKKWGSVTSGFDGELVIFSLEWPLFTKHWELDKGWLEKCSYDSLHTVSFDTKTATKIDAIKVNNNSLISEPNIELSGEKPEGWYTDKACQNKWNFTTDRVDSDITLYAKWNLKVWKVTFDFDINKETVEAMNGLTVSRPQDPMRLDYRFEGWYHDDTFQTPWNFDKDTVTADTTIYGKWTESPGYDPYGVNAGGDVDTGGMSYDVEYNGHKYKHIMTYMTYAEAQRYAERYGGYLMTINSKAEQDILARYVNNDCAQQWLWLGITNENGNNWNFWSTGEEVIYSNWTNGQPDSANTYGVMSRSGGWWSTLPKNETAHFVIEWGATNSVIQQNQDNDIRYSKNNNTQTAKVVGYTGNSESIKIDDTYGGYPVTEIEEGAFKGCTTLKSVVLPQNLKTIGEQAFSGCTNLKTINLPDTVTEVGENCFEDCTSLVSVVWSANAKWLDKNVFKNDASLTTITNIQSVTSILENSFYGCVSLLNFVFPAGLTTIGRSAFYNCRSLRDIVLPNSLTTVQEYAFSGCSGAIRIIISDKLSAINNYVFSGCSSVTDVYIPSTVSKIYDYAFNNVSGKFHVYNGSVAERWASGKSKDYEVISSYRINFVTYTDGGASGGTIKAGEQTSDAYIAVGSRITEPVIEREGMTIEGWYLDEAFTKPWDFALDKMPAENITLYARWVENSDLFSFNVSNNEATITYYNGQNYNVVIPESICGYKVTGIGTMAFVSSSIGMLTVPATVKSISDAAFDCPNLIQITVNGTKYYKTDETGALYNASGSRLVYVPQGLKITEYTIPDGTKQIASRAFLEQTTLKKVYIPDSATKIAQDAFERVPFLTIYGSVEECAAKTFATKYNYSYNLYHVSFYYDNELIYDILNPAGSIIEDYYRPYDDFSVFGGWFKDSSLTQEWNFDTDVMPQEDINLYLKWTTLFAVSVNNREVTITGYTGDAADIVIPETLQGYSVSSIAFSAFNRSGIKSITIPSSVVSIENGAIATSIKIIGEKDSAAYTYARENGHTFIERKYTISFESYGGSEIADIQAVPGKTVNLPIPIRNGYTFNGWYPDTGFESEDKWTANTTMPSQDIKLYAQWLQMSTIDTSVYGYEVLADGTIEITSYTGSKLSLEIPDTVNGYTVSRIGNYAFSGNSKMLSVTVPKTVTSIGEGAFEDSVIRVVKGTGNVTKIENRAFMNASGLYSIAIGNALEEIGEDAFRGTGLTDFSAKTGLKTIGARAFYGCEFLDSVVLNAGLTHLGDKAFAECTRLKEATIPTYVSEQAKLAFDSSVSLTMKGSSNITILSWSVGDGANVTVSWNGVSGATQYVLARKTETVAKLTRWSTYYASGIRQATVKAGQAGQTAEIVVIACDENKKAICQSEPIVVYLSTIDTPKIMQVTQTGAQTAQMTIERVKGASGYEIERTNEPNGEFTHLKNVVVASFSNSGLLPGVDYYYRIRAYQTVDGEKIYSRYSDVYYFHMPYKYVTAPENVTARQTAAKAITVNWNAVDEADGYYIYRSKSGEEYVHFATTTSNEYVNTGVVNGRNYEYKIRAYFSENGERILSDESLAVSITVRSVLTPEITNVSQFRTNVVKVTWSVVADAVGYTLYRSNSINGDYKKVKSVTTTVTNDLSSITAGDTYYYKVCAYKLDDAGNQIVSEMSPAVSLAIKSTPKIEGLTATQNSGSSAKVSWNSVSGVEGYALRISANDQYNYELYTDTTEKTVSVTGLHDGVTYYLAVSGYVTIDGEKSYGDPSDAFEITILGTPAIQVLEQEGTKAVRIIWKKVDSAEGYEVWRQDGTTATYKLWRTLTGTTALNTSLAYNTVYGYKVRSYKMVDGVKQYSPYSEIKKIRLLDAPTLSKIELTDTRAATLSWTKVTGATGYDVYRSNEADGVFKLWKTIDGLTATNTSLSVGTMYFYKVIPYSEINGEKQLGKPSAVKGILVLPTPKITSIENASSTSVKVSWNEVEGATGYKLFRDTTENGTYGTVKRVTTLNTTSINLTEGTKYYFKVVAYTVIDGVTYESLPSDVSSVKFINLAKPTFTSMQQPTAASVILTWGKVSGATGYELVRSETIDGTYKSIKNVTELSATNTSLKVGSTYYYKVRAFKQFSSTEISYGLFSDPIAVLLLTVPKITAVDRIGNTNAKVTWNAVDNATSYKLYRSTEVDGTYKLIKTTNETTYQNGGLSIGTQYFYKVAAVNESNGIANIGPKSTSGNVTINDLSYTKITSYVQNGDGTVTLRWNAIDGAEGYEVSKAEQGGGFGKVKNTTSTTTTITGLTNGTTYSFRVRMYKTIDGKKQYGGYSTSVSVALMNAPVITSATHSSPTEVIVNWSAVEGATSYMIYQKAEGSSYKLAGTTSNTTLTCNGLTKGILYLYKVLAVRATTSQTNKSGYSGEYTAYIMESAHNYTNNMNQTWSYTIDGASSLVLKFSSLSTFENNYDKLYITDSNGNSVGNSPYSGTTLAGATITVPGDTVNLRMTTDGSVTYYGFAVESIKAVN